jgi:hypothetical protein
MGAKLSKTTTAAPAPVAVPNPKLEREWVRYRMTFTATVLPLDGEEELSRGQIHAARVAVRDQETWSEYIHPMMRDALETEFLKLHDLDISLRDSPPANLVNVRLYKSINDAHPPNKMRGRVVWSSLECDLACLGSAAAWRIGDRMAQYGVMDEQEGWWVHITPGKITVLEE